MAKKDELSDSSRSQQSLSPDNDVHSDEERRHFDSVCTAYRQYATFTISQLTHRDFRLSALSQSQQRVLPSSLKVGTPEHALRSKKYKDAAVRNQFCLDCILRHAGQPHSQERRIPNLPTNSLFVSDDKISKVSSVLKSLARDWSSDGEFERATAYSPIKTYIQKYLASESRSLSSERARIAVPGSGVGRLAFDLVAMGYNVQGNEYSMYMLLASDFILNNGGSICSPEQPLQISPWLLESRNLHTAKDSFRMVQIPDVDPMTILMPENEDEESLQSREAPEFSMAAGEFSSIYSHEREANQWDCVASCFFLDATPNIVETLEVIYKMLRPGGLLINFGPLLYHWSGPPIRPDDKSLQEYRQRYNHLDDRYFTSIDLCYDEIKQILEGIGFEILEEKTGIECYYTTDQHSMMKTKYECVSFVARKTT